VRFQDWKPINMSLGVLARVEGYTNQEKYFWGAYRWRGRDLWAIWHRCPKTGEEDETRPVVMRGLHADIVKLVLMFNPRAFSKEG
jgi:hypothetical protein